MILDARNACDCSRHHHAHHGDARHETMESARLIAGNPGPYRVTKGRPCPVCGREKWCCFDPLSGICLCPRQADGALQDHSFRPIRLGELGFLHVHGAASIYAGGSPARPTRASRAKSDAANDPARLAKIQAIYRTSGDHLRVAAEELALPAESLQAFGLGQFNFYFNDAGKNCPTRTWPEWSATGDIVGLGHRRQGDGQKRFQGKRGIILTEAHAADRAKLRADIVARGRVVVPEGFTDTVAAQAMGEVAIGRPSVSGGVVAIADLLNSLALPETVEVVLLGENDLAADGRWPGRDLAMEGARKLARLLGYRFRVVVVMPPAGIKDLRAAWQAGYRDWDSYRQAATILETSETSASSCGLVADTLPCPDSSVLKPNTVPRKRDKWTLPQRIRTLFASNPWSCSKVRGVAGRETATFSPALIAAGCGTWICPVCGEYRRLRAYDRFGFHIFHHDGELYCDTVADFDWPAVLKTMRRRAKKLNVPLRYVSIRVGANNLTVIASVPILDVACPIEFSEALEVLECALVDVATDCRPIAACREWGLLPKEHAIERVPGGCTPAAFRKTAESWGTVATSDGGRFIKAGEGLFLDENKQLDEAAEVDYWFEAWLRDHQGDAEADTFHLTAAEQRERITTAVDVPAEPVGPATIPTHVCTHERIEETQTHDGFINRKCRDCEAWLPCRKPEEQLA